MLSFQPEANTGRTIFSQQPVTPDDVWAKICEGAGMNLDRHFAVFGHPDCNNWYPLLVSQISGRHIAFPPQDARTRKLFADAIAKVGGVSFVKDDAGTTPFRILGIVTQNPALMLRLDRSRRAIGGERPGAVSNSRAPCSQVARIRLAQAFIILCTPIKSRMRTTIRSCARVWTRAYSRGP